MCLRSRFQNTRCASRLVHEAHREPERSVRGCMSTEPQVHPVRRSPLELLPARDPKPEDPGRAKRIARRPDRSESVNG